MQMDVARRQSAIETGGLRPPLADNFKFAIRNQEFLTERFLVMLRKCFACAFLALVASSLGCRMCAHCDEAGPVDASACPDCAVGRSGSAISGPTTVIEGEPTPAYAENVTPQKAAKTATR